MQIQERTWLGNANKEAGKNYQSMTCGRRRGSPRRLREEKSERNVLGKMCGLLVFVFLDLSCAQQNKSAYEQNSRDQAIYI